MRTDPDSTARVELIRDAAVRAVMRFGRLERSAVARLAVLRRDNLMIAYRTPFNPLPPLSEEAKFMAAREGKTAYLQPYGIDIWQTNTGRVMSVGWREGRPLVADFYRPGKWEKMLEPGAILADAPLETVAQDTVMRAVPEAPHLEKTASGRKPRRKAPAR